VEGESEALERAFEQFAASSCSSWRGSGERDEAEAAASII
jgi:hypothetical protein